MAFRGETEGDHYNCACPFCGKNNHFITDGVTLHLNQVRIFLKPCHSCKKIVFYRARYEIMVTASKGHPIERHRGGEATVSGVKPKAKKVLVHADGPCFDNRFRTRLTAEGDCPVCEIHPDMQSTEFIFCCPSDDVELKVDNCCSVCGIEYDVS